MKTYNVRVIVVGLVEAVDEKAAEAVTRYQMDQIGFDVCEDFSDAVDIFESEEGA